MKRAIALGAMRGAVFLWVCLHVVLLLLPGPSFTAVTVLFVPPLIGALVLLDQRVSNESLFLANVGIRPSVAPLAAALTGLALELAALAVTAA